MANENQFDRMIDEGVRQYMDAEPSLGLESRVLAALEEKRRRAWWRRWWVMAVPALAALVLVMGLAMNRKPVPSAPVAKDVPRSSARPSAPVVAEIPPTSDQSHPSQKRAWVRRPGAVAAKETRPAQFPSPVEATEQEKILAQLVRRGRAPVAVAEMQQSPAKDVEVPPIQISEVQIKPLPDSNNGQ